MRYIFHRVLPEIMRGGACSFTPAFHQRAVFNSGSTFFRISCHEMMTNEKSSPTQDTIQTPGASLWRPIHYICCHCAVAVTRTHLHTATYGFIYPLRLLLVQSLLVASYNPGPLAPALMRLSFKVTPNLLQQAVTIQTTSL